MLFFLCWLPFFSLNVAHVFIMWNQSKLWTPTLDALFVVFTWLGYLNSTLNPIIYSLINRKFRAAFKRLLGCGSSRRPNRKLGLRDLPPVGKKSFTTNRLQRVMTRLGAGRPKAAKTPPSAPDEGYQSSNNNHHSRFWLLSIFRVPYSIYLHQ